MRIPYIRHWLYRTVQRLRHSRITKAWMEAEALRLDKTVDQIAYMLRTLTARQISNLPSGGGGGGGKIGDVIGFTAGAYTLEDGGGPGIDNQIAGFLDASLSPFGQVGTKTSGPDGVVLIATTGYQGAIGTPTDTPNFDALIVAPTSAGLTSIKVTAGATTVTLPIAYNGDVGYWAVSDAEDPSLPLLPAGTAFTVELA